MPKLRAGDIRTLAEAERACLALTDVLDEQHRAGWDASGGGAEPREPNVMARIDSYPYRHRIAASCARRRNSSPPTLRSDTMPAW